MKRLRLTLVPLLLVIWTNNNINAGSATQGRFDFYGHVVNIAYDYSYSSLTFSNYSQTEITNLLRRYRDHNLQETARRIEEQATFFKLDDVGKSILIDKMLNGILGKDKSNQKAFIKYTILKELGYDVLLTRTGTNLNCLGNLSFIPGRYLYIQYNNKTYKDLDFSKRLNGGKHLIYIDKQKTYRTITRDLLSTPEVNAHILSKKVQFTYRDSLYEVEVKSNGSVLEFLNDIPMYSIGKEYTTLNTSKELNQTLLPYLRRQLTGKSSSERVSFLLAFVQQVTQYGSDYDKYGEEKFYYPEETIMASTADCEDKTFLLAYLAKRLLNIKAVGLYFEYDEHLSLGLQIPDENAYSFTYKGEKYLACEPTAKTPRLGYSSINLKRVTRVIPL